MKEKQNKDKNKSDVYDKVLSKVLNFLSYKDRTQYELSQAIDRYLSAFGPLDFGEVVKEDLLAELAKLGLVDDLEFARAYIREKKRSARPASSMALKRFLYRKGVSWDDINEALMAEYTEEDARLAISKLVDKKLKALRKFKNKEVRKKLVKYLLGKGFGFEIVCAVVDTKLQKD